MTRIARELWFGDERRYNATVAFYRANAGWLWFGDERRYNATQFRPMDELV